MRFFISVLVAITWNGCIGDVGGEGSDESGLRGSSHCVVAPNPAQIDETYAIEGTGLTRLGSVEIVIEDAARTQRIAATTGEDRSIVVQTSSAAAGPGRVAIWQTDRSTHKLLTVCDFTVTDGCVPAECAPGDCGVLDDGCGGTVDCGACNVDGGVPDETMPDPFCGDGSCGSAETCSSCPGDCGSCPSTGALDRHVYLDVDGDGQLDDCPNPAHSVDGSSDRTGLVVCDGSGSYDGSLVCGVDGAPAAGCRIGTVGSGTCEADGGRLTALRSGSSADVDGDGEREPVYGHPQACVWHLGLSDDCDVHAGVYDEPGGACDANCTERGTMGLCDSGEKCWRASIVALGMGPNLDSEGYGTADDPAELRGATMLGATDSWDADGDKHPDRCGAGIVCEGDHSDPDSTSWPAIISGDHAGDGTTSFTETTCTTESCSGDAHYAVILGCTDNWGEICDTSHAGGESGPEIDSDGDGTIDHDLLEPKQNVDHFTIRDLEFQGYNGGRASPGSTPRGLMGHFSLGGESHRESSGSDGRTDGTRIDHIYVHDNDYSLAPSTEMYWSVFHDGSNMRCADYTEFANSFIVQNNEKIWNSDTCNNCTSGCPQFIHDNRILVDVRSPRASGRNPALGYWKNIDNRGTTSVSEGPKALRFWNNEVVIRSAGSGIFGDIGLFGNANEHGQGEMWIYGNVFRRHPTMTANWRRFFNGFCHQEPGRYPANTSWRLYVFNNTMDLGLAHYRVCGASSDASSISHTGERIVERNNVWLSGSQIHEERDVETVSRGDELCRDGVQYAGAMCTVPAAPDFGSWVAGPALAPLHGGLDAYSPATGSPILDAGGCDPDGDGVTGVDYDGDGTNDLGWYDLAGTWVDCSSASTRIQAGAIQ